VIRRRGENVAPVEIEEALASHPDVHEVAVVGVPSELSEEEIKAFLVIAPDADLAAIRSHAAALLAPFKVPRYMEPIAELPHTPTGRVAKHELPAEPSAAEIDFEPPRASAPATERTT
jgi:crotonobetaine/carnitine-CoA ligase